MAVHKDLGCRGISRSDFILDEASGEPVFLAINTQPGPE
jgi:D-alanine-D-alanine ligase